MSILPEVTQAAVLVVGASRGIGLGFVKQLLDEPRVTKIYATYRDPASAAELLALSQWHGATGGESQGNRLVLLRVDITQEEQIAAALETIQAESGKLHLALYCVGLLHGEDFQPEKSLRSLHSDQLLRYFQVNAIGAGLLAKHLMGLLRHGELSIFAAISAKVGSIGDNQLGGWYGYRASKAALNMLMKTTALEYERRCPQTLVVLLHPGTTDTQLSEPFQTNVPPGKLFSVERTVKQLLAVLSKVGPGDSGKFYSWDGSELPW
jgi:NAD(P)-dependent dehydrogenase (short-subunit alcohol dehydrogenase family)